MEAMNFPISALVCLSVLSLAQAQTLQEPISQDAVDELAGPAFALSVVLVIAVLVLALGVGITFLLIWLRLDRDSSTVKEHHALTKKEIRAAKKAKIRARIHKMSAAHIDTGLEDLEIEAQNQQTLENVKHEESQREQELMVQVRLQKKRSAHKQVKPALSTLDEDGAGSAVDADVVGSEIIDNVPAAAVGDEPVAGGSAADGATTAASAASAVGAERPHSMTAEAIGFAAGTRS
jgi:hypothetical protein